MSDDDHPCDGEDDWFEPELVHECDKCEAQFSCPKGEKRAASYSKFKAIEDNPNSKPDELRWALDQMDKIERCPCLFTGKSTSGMLVTHRSGYYCSKLECHLAGKALANKK